MSNTRPTRLQLADFAGRLITLADSPEQWQLLEQNLARQAHNQSQNQAKNLLLLGLVPIISSKPQNLAFVQNFLAQNNLSQNHLGKTKKIFYLCYLSQELKERLSRDLLEQWQENLAQLANLEQWQAVDAKLALELAPNCQCYFYRQNLQLDPQFWGHFLAKIQLQNYKLANNDQEPIQASQLNKSNKSNNSKPLLLLPGDKQQLLHNEILLAAQNIGLEVLELPTNPKLILANLDQILNLSHKRKVLFLAINLAGLDPDGQIAYCCLNRQIQVALWFVDNPWHILSLARLPWWQECQLFVTDASFIPELEKLGAKAKLLPLAVADQMWQVAKLDKPKLLSQPLFVGRSEFPKKKQFFAAAKVPTDLENLAFELLNSENQQEPDFHWWHTQLGKSALWQGQLWPGQKVREVGLGAENCSQLKRTLWLKTALASHKWTIIGDAGWQKLLPEAQIQAPVDYYRELPHYYHHAQAVLNVTSLLLPESLSQRHFDVFAAGTLLLSDATKGLAIFPADLVEDMQIKTRSELPAKLEYYLTRPKIALDLVRAWQAELKAKHGYGQRLKTILDYKLF